MIAAGAEAFFAAESDASGIEQIAEELPARGCFKALDPQLFGHHIHCSASRHGACHPGEAACISRGQGCVGGEHRQAVAGIHEAALPQDHVAITVAVAGCPEAIVIAFQQQLRQIMGVGEVGVGVAFAEILQGDAVANAACRCTQKFFEQPRGVGPGHRMHGIEGQRKIAADQIADAVEVEQLLHQLDEVVDAIDHFNNHGADGMVARGIETDGWSINDRILLQGFGAFVHRIGEGGWSGATVGAVHLHAEVAVGATRVMAGRQDDAADRLAAANQVGGRRSGEDPAGGGDYFADAMGGCHAQDHINGTAVAVAAIATEHKGASLHTREGAEDRFNEAFQIVRLLELLAAFAQA